MKHEDLDKIAAALRFVGPTSADYVRECLLPRLAEQGLIIVRAPAAEDAPSPPTDDRRFPVLDRGSRTIPWALVEPLRASALRFYLQTLEWLAERGGLPVEELHMHAHGLRWPLADKPAIAQWFEQWSAE